AKQYPNIKAYNLRMQAMNFSKGCPGGKELRGKLLTVKEVVEIERIMKEFQQSLEAARELPAVEEEPPKQA
ncbi:MAG: hypothetical protein AAB271_06265, partial [Nitrospirota bacterium]